MRNKKLNFITVMLVVIMLFSVLLLPSCSDNGNDDVDEVGKNAVEEAKSFMKSGKYPVVTMVYKNIGTIKLELYPEKAPQTVYNFISLINDGFYDGLTIHRVDPQFVIQGGDPAGNGTGGPGYNIKGEFGINGFSYNDIEHKRGVISMARSSGNDTAGSQFFIVLKDSAQRSLDLKYAGFGMVIEGFDVLDKIVAVGVEPGTEIPATPVIIEKVTVETFGDEYPEPEKL